MNTEQNQTTWYVLRGEERLGPYSYAQMAEFIQHHALLDYHYVWSSHLDQWTMLCDLKEFASENLKPFFFERRNPRKKVNLPILIHDNKRIFTGELTSLSVQGGLIRINSPLLNPGDQLTLHVFANNQIENAFLMSSKILRKGFAKGRINVKTDMDYAVRFLQVPENGLIQITKMTA